jgi:hypothetical protein
MSSVVEDFDIGDADAREAEPDPWSARSMIRLLIADDHGIVREGLERLFGTVADVEVVGSAADGREGRRRRSHRD